MTTYAVDTAAASEARSLVSRGAGLAALELARTSLTLSMLAAEAGRALSAFSGDRAEAGDDEQRVERERELRSDALRGGVDEEHQRSAHAQRTTIVRQLSRAPRSEPDEPSAIQNGGRG